MRQTTVTTDLLGATVTDGEHSDALNNRQLSYYRLTSPAIIHAVFPDREGNLKLLIVDSNGNSAEVFPSQVKIWSATHENPKSK